MTRVVEMSLDARAMAVHDRVQQTVGEAAGKRPATRRAKRGAPDDGAGSAFEAKLAAAANLALAAARKPIAIHRLELDGRLVEAGWRVVVEASSDGQRLIVSHSEPHAPAVRVRETVCEAALETGVSAAQRASLPSELLVALDAASERVRSVPPLALQRTAWRWTGPDGHIVDIALNEASGDTPGRAGPPFRELLLSARCDVEDDAPLEPAAARDGTGRARLASAVRALFAAAAELAEALPVFPTLEEALEQPPRDPHDEEPVRALPIDLVDAHTPHAALISIGGNVARHWFGNEHGVRATATVEFVHQMRVAQRRLKTALRIFPAWADADWKERVAPGLAWLGELLGEARDLDVFADFTLPALVGADTDASAWSAVAAEADALRLGARERLQEAMRSRRYAQLSLAWLGWLGNLPLRDAPEEAAALTLREYAAKRVRKQYQRLADGAKLTEVDAETRHRHRIEAKRLRYMLEFFESIGSGHTRRDIARTLQRIQSVLGDGNDASVALGFLERLDVTPYQLGFARGWSHAVIHCMAQEGERLLQMLEAPRIKRRG